MGINTFGKLGPVNRHTAFYHFRRKVAPIVEVALRHRPPVVVDIRDIGRYGLAFAQCHECPFRLLSIWMLKFRGVYAEEADLCFLQNDRVPVNHVRPTLYGDGWGYFFRAALIEWFWSAWGRRRAKLSLALAVFLILCLGVISYNQHDENDHSKDR